ncbi:MAG: hypothetical protein KC620_04680 [Myxococcales bacterium]|nr:hypothetical protein [Myxococcales bacterium]
MGGLAPIACIIDPPRRVCKGLAADRPACAVPRIGDGSVDGLVRLA